MRTKHTSLAIDTIASAFHAGDDIRANSISTALAKFCRDSGVPTQAPRQYGLIAALECAKSEGQLKGATIDIYKAEVTRAFSIFWTKFNLAQEMKKSNSGQNKGLTKSEKKETRKAQKKANKEYMNSPDKTNITPPSLSATKYHTPPQSPAPVTPVPAPVVPAPVVPAPVVPAPVVPAPAVTAPVVPAPVVPAPVVPAPVVTAPAVTAPAVTAPAVTAPASANQNSLATKIYDAFYQRPALYIFLASSALGGVLALALFAPFTLACTLTFVGASLGSSTIMGGVAAKIYFDNHVRNSGAQENAL